MFESDYQPETYVVDATGPDDEAAALGVKWLIEFATTRRLVPAGIFVATLQQVDHFARFLGAQGAEALRRDRQLTINDVPVQLLTERTLPHSFAGPILCMWAREQHLESIEALRPPAICAVPFKPSNLENWKLARSPRDLRTGVAPGPKLVASAVLTAAVRDLTRSVNVSTGIISPSDKASAIDLFRTLREAGEPFTGTAVRALAQRDGWEGAHARALGDLADKIAAGRQVRSRGALGVHWGPSSLEKWRRGEE